MIKLFYSHITKHKRREISVNNIIYQIIEELGRNILKNIEEGGLSDIDQFASEALELCKGSVRELISEIVEQLNKEFRSDKKFRKELGLALKEKDRQRSLLTEVGLIDFKRDYKHEKESDTYFYPLDIMIGLTPYERIGANVSARLLMEVAEVSYEKSAKIVTNGDVSRQTVKNKILAVGKLEKDAPTDTRVAKELHVFADEDHANLQEGGKSRMVPLITISEGIRAVGEGRNELVNQVHFTGQIKKTKEAWEHVGGYISQAYDENEIEIVYLHGDGAPWIKQGIDELPNCVYVIDSFYFEKHLKHATAGFGHRNYRMRIRQAIFEKDRDKALDLVNEMLTHSKERKQARRVLKFRSYLVNNWEEDTLKT